MKIYKSPFRDDQKPSLGFFKHRSGCLSFKDYGTNQKGNLIQFVRMGLGCSYPDDEAYDLIQKQVGLVGDSSWIKHEPMLVVGQYFGRGIKGQKFCHDAWGMIEPERLIGCIRGLYKPSCYSGMEKQASVASQSYLKAAYSCVKVRRIS